MNRPTTSLLATLGALLAVTGIATVSSGDDQERQPSAAERAEPRPVQRTTLTCPRPAPAASGAVTTWYSAYTPAAEAAPEQDVGSAELLPAEEYAPGQGAGQDGDGDGNGEGNGNGNGDAGQNQQNQNQQGEDGEQRQAKPVAPVSEPGRPASATRKGNEVPALIGTAEERLAPGWTVQQTTRVDSGGGRGLLGTSCQAPDTGFWFAGASTVEQRQDYVHITNPDETATVVDIALHGPDGALEAEAGQNITVPGNSTVPVLLSTLTDEEEEDLAVEVTARTGRIGVQIEAVDERSGADWLPPASPEPGGPLVLPGIPADAENVRLVAYAPGDEDVTLQVGLAGPTGVITPAGNETVSVSAGALTTVDLGRLTRGQTGSLVLTPAAGSGAGSLVAALRVTEGKGDRQEMAFIPATTPITQRASIAGNTADGTELSLTAVGSAAKVEVTISGGAGGGQPTTQRHTVEAGTTLAVTPEPAQGVKGRYALTVKHLGGGPLYAARILTEAGDGEGDAKRMFTIQTLPDDRSTVIVPQTGQDLSVLIDG